jgi:ribosomal protein S24E
MDFAIEDEYIIVR